MPVIDLHSSEFDEGTLAKLELFQDYLQEWLPVFIHTPNHSAINIIDFFAGSGADAVGNAGSPIRILDIIERFADTIIQKKLKINVILNEYNLEKFNKLKELASNRLNANCLFAQIINVEYKNEDFTILFNRIAQRIKFDSNLFFFDQNGIKHINTSVLETLDSFTRTDFLFFISSSYFLRFDFKNHHPDIKNCIETSKPANIHRQVAKYFQNKLPATSITRLYPFTIKKLGGYYGLVFGSQNSLAIEKFLNICWKKNETNGEANFDIDEEFKLRQLSLFGPKKFSKIQQFSEALQAFVVENKEVTNRDVLEFTLTRGFAPKQASQTLKEMRDIKLIEHFSYPKIGYDQVYNKKEVVIFKVR
jgi:three-Cys-motif partner protein